MAYDVKIDDSVACQPTDPTKIEVVNGKIVVTFSNGSTREDDLPVGVDTSGLLPRSEFTGHTHTLAEISDFDPLTFATAAQGASADSAVQPGANLSVFTNDLNIPTDTELTNTNNTINNHILDTSNPHGVTKGQVGLGSVDNTSDVNKPVSIAQQTEITSKYNAAISYVNTKISGKVDKITGSRLMTSVEGAKIASFDDKHYKTPVADLTALAALAENSLYDKERRYVASEGKDYFYRTGVVTGDIAPVDQTGGTGFWVTTAQEAVDTYDQWLLSTGGTFRKTMVKDSVLDLQASGLLSVAYTAEGKVTYSTTATKNDTDANLKARANHTGTQAISTITGLQDALDDMIVEITQVDYDALVTAGSTNPKTLYIIT